MKHAFTLLSSSLFLTGCGPDPTEVGQLLIMVSSAALLVSFGFIALLKHLWRCRIDGFDRVSNLTLATGATLFVLGIFIVNAFYNTTHAIDPAAAIGEACWMVGGSVLTLSLVLWRLGQVFGKTWAYLGPMIFSVGFALLAVPLAAGSIGSGVYLDAVLAWALLPGANGYIAIPVLALMLGEGLWRWNKRAMQSQCSRPS